MTMDRRIVARDEQRSRDTLDAAHSLMRDLRGSAKHDLDLSRQPAMKQNVRHLRRSAEQKLLAASMIRRMIRVFDNEI